MKVCNLNYIPQHLHENDKPDDIPFVVDEELYRRCTPETLDNPFQTISIAELSHNRSGPNRDMCQPNDVLWNIREDEEIQQYNQVVCTLKIVDLSHDGRYEKLFEQVKNGPKPTDSRDVRAVMTLVHEPDVCMYPHSVFRVILDGELVTLENHKQTLGKMTIIRNKIKEELAYMILTKEVSNASV